MARVLVVNAAGEALEAARDALAMAGHSVEVVDSGRDAMGAMACKEFDVVVAEVGLGEASGIDLCRAIVAGHHDVPVVLFTDEGVLDTAIAAIRAGAYDYLTRPIAAATFVVSVERALQHRSLRREISLLDTDDLGVVASLPTLREVERRYIARVLGLVANNKTTASRVLGIDRKTLYRKLEDEAERRQEPQ